MKLSQCNISNIALITLFGCSSGLPLALSGSTLQAWMAANHIDLAAIGFMGLLAQPYVYKFLWAPLLDRYVPPFLGRRRGWLFVFQLLLAILTASLGYFEPKQHMAWIAILVFSIAFVSASQDILVDAYRTEILTEEERGLGAASYIWGYRIAMFISGALCLIFADKLGWTLAFWIMALCMLAMTLVTLWAPEPELQAQPPQTLAEAVIEPAKEFLARKNAIGILLFIAIYKLGYEAILAMTMPFLITGLGFSLIEVGVIYKTVGLVAILLGALGSGVLLVRLSIYRALLWFGALQAAANLSFIFLAWFGKNAVVLAGVVFLDNLTSGMQTAAFVAFLMSLCHQSYTATQFALFSALSSVGRIFVAPLAGIIAKHLGWIDFYTYTFLLSIPGLILLQRLAQTPTFVMTAQSE